MKTTIQIGKNGITEGVIEEIKSQIKKRKIVKIKFMKNTDRENFKSKVEELANLTDSEIVEIRGFTVVLKKKGYQI